MSGKEANHVHVRNIVSLYSSSDMIVRFRPDIGFSILRHKENIILERCLEMERANMAIMGGLSTPYFYLHFHVIHELGVLIPFTPGGLPGDR